MKLLTVNKVYTNILLGCLLLVSSFLFAQKNHFPNTNFRSPVDIPLRLAGNFGEIRTNHFHSGLDVKTNGVEGLNIYSIEDGYVSRIGISANGYGTALYITHPNGFVSVYAHLQKLTGKIGEYAKAAQYKNQTFEININLKSYELPVKKGDVVAKSGNSGGSRAPHLHFEIREEKSEYPVNPLLFGFNIIDNVAPKLSSLVIYPMSETSTVNGASKSITEKIFKSHGQNSLVSGRTNTVNGSIGFGISGNDYLTGESNPCGFYSVELFVDSEIIYSHTIDKYSFDESRYINSLIDYDRNSRTGHVIQRSFVEPGNNLSIYNNIKNRGVYNFTDDNIHDIKYVVKDVYGNTSTLNFKVKSSSAKKDSPEKINQSSTLLPYNKENIFKANNITVTMPAGAFYNNIDFEFETINSSFDFSDIYSLHNDHTPLHKAIEICILPTSEIPNAIKSKTVIVRSNSSGAIKKSVGGSWMVDKLCSTTKYLGYYRIAIDSVPPRIKPINISEGRDMSRAWNIRFGIGDNISGIKSYNAYINDKWVLMEYDAKMGIISYNIDENCPDGTNEIRLIVTDECNNTATYKASFTR